MRRGEGHRNEKGQRERKRRGTNLEKVDGSSALTPSASVVSLLSPKREFLSQVVGLYFTRVQFEQQEKNREDQFELQEMNRKFEAGVQLMSQRELSEMEFRQKMFDVLVAKEKDPAAQA